MSAAQPQPQFIPMPKAMASLKAVKTAFTGKTMLFTQDDAVQYEKLVKMIVDHHRPATFQEELLVQSIIDSEWRSRSIAVIEQGILSMGHLELADSVPADILPAAVYLKYQRQLKDLSAQENRLFRYRESDLKKLQAMQAARREREMLRRKMEQRQPRDSQPEPKAASVTAAAPAIVTPSRC